MFYVFVSLILILSLSLPCAEATLTPIEISEAKEAILLLKDGQIILVNTGRPN